MTDNPNGVAFSSPASAATPLGLKTAAPPTQGSSCLATLGWWTQSLWDCQNSGLAVFERRQHQPGKMPGAHSIIIRLERGAVAKLFGERKAGAE